MGNHYLAMIRRINPFPYTTDLQQTTLKISHLKHEKSLYTGIKVYLLFKVENIMAKGEIACFEQFLLFSQCFQMSSAAEGSKSVYMWERVKYWVKC